MKKVSFFYGSGSGFSGQRFAMELAIKGLLERGWVVNIVNTPLLDRINISHGTKKFVNSCLLFPRLLIAWGKGSLLIFLTYTMVISPGQTKFALLRDGMPLLIKPPFIKNRHIILSLHGSVFMNWHFNALEARLLRRLVKTVCHITVLGPNQLTQLVKLGIPKEKIIILNNTCSFTPLTKKACIAKQTTIANNPIEVLFLSSLIESKGYIEFIKAISEIAKEDQHFISATLCGKITFVNNKQFTTLNEAVTWIKQQVETINQSEKVRILWINGARGKEKENLFTKAHIFVLPTQYKVEAQPIVILEALASGCAVITTKVGEIPTMVSNRSALFLDQVTYKTLANAIIKLQQYPTKRQNLAVEGLELFKNRFSYATYIDQWEQLITRNG